MLIKTALTIIGDRKYSTEFKAPDEMAGLHSGSQVNLGKLVILIREYLEKSKVLDENTNTCDMTIRVKTDDGYEGGIILSMGIDDSQGSGTLQLSKASEPDPDKIPVETKKPDSSLWGYVECHICKGSGMTQTKHSENKCRKCRGNGKVFDKDQYQIDKDGAMHPDKRKRMEEESEARAYRYFSGRHQ